MSSRRKPSLKVLGNIGLAVLALCTVGAVGSVFLTPAAPPPVSPQVQAFYDEKSKLDTTEKVFPPALFIGDSYTRGAGASTPGSGYAQVTATSLGWGGQYVSDPASGFLARGVDGKNFADLVAEAPAAEFQFVVVATGYNDPSRTVGLDSAIGAGLDAVKAKWPKAKVIILGPWTPSGEPKVTQVEVRDMLRDAAAARSLTLIDPVEGRWFAEASIKTVDGVHPDDAGHAAIAGLLSDEIRAKFPEGPFGP